MAIKNQINRIPRGFLGLLRGKVGGQTPITFAESIQPTVDLTGLYGDNLVGLTASQNTGLTSGEATSATLTVAADEVWLVHSLSCSVKGATASAQQCLASLVLRVPTSAGGGTALYRLAGGYFAKIATDTGGMLLSWSPGKVFMLPPGSKVAVNIEEAQVGGGAITYTNNAIYTPLDV